MKKKYIHELKGICYYNYSIYLLDKLSTLVLVFTQNLLTFRICVFKFKIIMNVLHSDHLMIHIYSMFCHQPCLFPNYL